MRGSGSTGFGAGQAAVVAVVAVWLLTTLFWLTPGLTRPDGAGYYAYLPSTYFDRDLLFFVLPLKEMIDAPISAPFRIYYGPFSSDLRETLSTMEGLDVVQTVPHEWGATYRIGRRYGQVRDLFPKRCSGWSRRSAG
jgi:hypothetical protein